jgi:hypothetical protein
MKNQIKDLIRLLFTKACEKNINQINLIVKNGV